MRVRTWLGGGLLGVAALATAASATHFDNEPATGSFNPQMSVTVSQTLVNRPTQFSLTVTQADHEDPPVVSRLRSPGAWQFAFAGTRRAEQPDGTPATRCHQAIDNDGNSPDGTGVPPNQDFSRRGDAVISRFEKVGTTRLQLALTHSRPGAPVVWNGDLGFLSYNSVTQTGIMCALLITTDTRIRNLPDPIPGDGEDSIEPFVEIIFDFPIALADDGANQWRETLVDLTEEIQSTELQTLDVSLIELAATFNANSSGNWHAGGIAFSKSPAVSGLRQFQGTFKTCPAADPAYGRCRSGRPDVIRTFNFTFTLPAPVITAPPNGALLNTNPVAISGTSDPFARVQVFEGGSPVGPEAVANAAGLWTANVLFPDGTHTVNSRVVDAGGQSPVSNSTTFTLDTTPPAAPIINIPVEGALIAGTSVAISGTAEALSTVEVREAGSTIATVVAGPTGSWNALVVMAKGPHAIAARATDLAGNTGPLSPLRSFNVTTAIPQILIPTEGAHTNLSPVVVSGVSEPNAVIKITEGGVPIGPPATASPAGLWSMSVAFAEGPHTLIATATEGGFESPPTPPRNFRVDFTAPPAPVITFPVEGQTVRSFLVNVAGTSEGFASIGVFEGAQRIGSATANGDGAWTVGILMPDGPHTIRAVATDRAGNVGPSSPNVSFFVQDPLIILNPLENAFVPGRVTISGEADPLATHVRLFEGQIEIGVAPVVDANWSITLNFQSGPHTITARSVSSSGVGPPSRPRTFRVDADAPNTHIDRASGHLLVSRLIGEPVTGDVRDARATDSLVGRIKITYLNLFTGEETVRDVACGGCPAPQVSFSDSPDLIPGVYQVTVQGFDVVGNSSSDDLFVLIV